jgi:CDGSH-type Zn-finger protein
MLNSNNLSQAHHVIEFAGEREVRTVKICRCWKSQKFPYCDNSHKQLLEHGETVGPFIARIEPHYPSTATIGNTAPNVVSTTMQLGKVFTRSLTGLAVLATVGASVYGVNKVKTHLQIRSDNLAKNTL